MTLTIRTGEVAEWDYLSHVHYADPFNVEGICVVNMGKVVPFSNFASTDGQCHRHASVPMRILSIRCIVRKSFGYTKEYFVCLVAVVIGLYIAVDIDASSVPVFGQVNTLCINIF